MLSWVLVADVIRTCCSFPALREFTPYTCVSHVYYGIPQPHPKVLWSWTLSGAVKAPFVRKFGKANSPRTAKTASVIAGLTSI